MYRRSQECNGSWSNITREVCRHVSGLFAQSRNRWQANLRILEVREIKTIPTVPLSHPFVERLIGTIRWEFLDHLMFWNGRDLERKLADFQHYYNHHRVHASWKGQTPAEDRGASPVKRAELDHFRWEKHCRGLVELPRAA